MHILGVTVVWRIASSGTDLNELNDFFILTQQPLEIKS